LASTAVKVVLGLVAGAVFGGVGGATVAGPVASFAVERAVSAASRGWRLTPVTVTARDLEPGIALTFDDITQRAFPEEMVTASLVEPKLAPSLVQPEGSIVRQRLQAPMHAGDPLWWGFFEATALQDVELAQACTSALDASGLLPKQVRSTAALRARLAAGAAR
jgi:Flp pilus assembly protein CpaB